MKYIYGIDVGGTTVKIGLFDEDGNFVKKWKIETNTKDNGKNILKDIAFSINLKNEELGVSLNDIIGFGFGIPGPVSGSVVNKCVNLGWDVVDVEKDFKEYLGSDILVKVGNDASVATLAEVWIGEAKGHKDVVMFTLGTGVGGGIVSNGEMVTGYNGTASELGHVIVEYDKGLSCNCGRTGCLETIASATGIHNMTKREIKSFQGNTILSRNLNAKAVFNVAKKGDELALKIVDYVSDKLALAIANIAVTTNPSVVVIGGGVSKAGDILVETVKKHYLKYAFYSVKDMDIKIAQCGNDAGMIGAAYLVRLGAK